MILPPSVVTALTLVFHLSEGTLNRCRKASKSRGNGLTGPDAWKLLDLGYAYSGVVLVSAGDHVNGGYNTWWELDLMGPHRIERVIITCVQTDFYDQAESAAVGVLGENREDDSQILGSLPGFPGRGSEYSFDGGHVSFDVHYIRISRNHNNEMVLGHVEVIGSEVIQEVNRCSRIIYSKMADRKLKPSYVHHLTGASNAGGCGILCYQRPDCVNFSFGKSAPADSNCLMSSVINRSKDPKDDQSTEEANDWLTYKLDLCE